MEGPEAIIVKNLGLVDTLKRLQRPSPIAGMEGELDEDPVAQELLRLDPNNFKEAESFLLENGINNLMPLNKAYGQEAVVLDASDKVVRLSRNAPYKQLNIPHVLQPLAQKIIGRLSVTISPKLETSDITEDDVIKVKSDLLAQGYNWSDAGTDNLGRDKDGKLFIIDGLVTKI